MNRRTFMQSIAALPLLSVPLRQPVCDDRITMGITRPGPSTAKQLRIYPPVRTRDGRYLYREVGYLRAFSQQEFEKIQSDFHKWARIVKASFRREGIWFESRTWQEWPDEPLVLNFETRQYSRRIL